MFLHIVRAQGGHATARSTAKVKALGFQSLIDERLMTMARPEGT